MKQKTIKKMFISLYVLIGIAILITAYINFHPVFGAKSKGAILKQMQESSNYANGKFQNIEETIVMVKDFSFRKILFEWIKGPENGKPDSMITQKFDKELFMQSDSGIHVIWLGHSSILLNIDGKIILTDPVFSKYASPVPFSNGSFTYTNKIEIEDLPNIDIVLISHDHYDHLDIATIKKLKGKVDKFYAPLGVDAHLIRWGVSPSKIIVADWWDNFNDVTGLKFIAAPARHFSGRGFTRNETLWCSWIIKSNSGNVFFGGDSGYGMHFKEIGDKYGPFDITMIECGQYGDGWPYIHGTPEQAIQANIDLGGKVMLPIHWGKFQLSLHSWTEPIERAEKEAKIKDIELLKLEVGEIWEVQNE